MSRTDIQSVISKIPNLNSFGVGLFDNGRDLTKEEQQKKLKENQEDLLNDIETFEKVCNWLSTKKKIKTINKRYSSYGLKHIAEREIGYNTNGIFIAAAVHCGFSYELIPDSPNVWFGISAKSINKIRPQRWYI